MDMEKDIFAEYGFGKLALQELAPTPENFRLYLANCVATFGPAMEVTGAEFRRIKTGPNKGKLSIKIKGTERTVRLSAEEIQAATNSEHATA